MTKLGIIGGSGLNQLEGMTNSRQVMVETRYGTAQVTQGELHGHAVVFMPRHGEGHVLPPHQINYRANIAALKQLGVEQVVACNAVGGIHPDMGPGKLVVPDQIVDYSYGREHTFAEQGDVIHIDFTYPYDETLRSSLLASLARLEIPHVDFGVYACTQGPRLESAAEITRLKRDGCDLVGMTAMPEAALAREAGLAYASLCLVANWGAGLTEDLITMEEILQVITSGVEQIHQVLSDFVPSRSN